MSSLSTESQETDALDESKDLEFICNHHLSDILLPISHLATISDLAENQEYLLQDFQSSCTNKSNLSNPGHNLDVYFSPHIPSVSSMGALQSTGSIQSESMSDSLSSRSPSDRLTLSCPLSSPSMPSSILSPSPSPILGIIHGASDITIHHSDSRGSYALPPWLKGVCLKQVQHNKRKAKLHQMRNSNQEDPGLTQETAQANNLPNQVIQGNIQETKQRNSQNNSDSPNQITRHITSHINSQSTFVPSTLILPDNTKTKNQRLPL